MSPGTPFAERVRSGERLLGGLVRMPGEQIVELLGFAGLDYVVIDTEHGTQGGVAMHHHIAIAESAGLATIVRVGQTSEILRALDLGADGVLIPHVAHAAEAAKAVRATRYPPRGSRGFAAYTRAAAYGLDGPANHYTKPDPVIFAMIEDKPGLEAVVTIAATDGVDGLMLGPADYAVELGLHGATADPRIAAANTAVGAAAAHHRRALMRITNSRAAAEAAFVDGAQLVVYNVQEVMTDAVRDLSSALPGRAGEE